MTLTEPAIIVVAGKQEIRRHATVIAERWSNSGPPPDQVSSFGTSPLIRPTDFDAAPPSPDDRTQCVPRGTQGL